MSKSAIEGLTPNLIWEQFYGISQVPRPSKKEEKVREYLRNFATTNNIDFKEDEVGNIVMFVPATKGYENAPTVVLQGHIDMVCEKNKDTEHDFDNDPIKLIKDGDWMRADGTTLGADNGIGVAAGLAAALDESVVHGPLEILCTVDEETGLTGVNALQPGFISGKYLLNMDSEEDGAFYVGCSGGQDTVGRFKIETEAVSEGMVPFELMITGLKGGHSGLDAANGRANAIKLLGQLLNRFENINYAVAKISGGSLRNAIPRESEVTLMIDPADEAKVQTIINEFVKDTVIEFKTNDGGLVVKFSKSEEKVESVLAKDLTQRIVYTILAMPHGVMAMSPDIPGLVETSTNLATINIEGDVVRVGTSQRSSIESAKMNTTYAVVSVFKLAGAEATIGDGYPGWQPNMDSDLLKISKSVFQKLFGKEPEIKAIHAGLETGLLGAKYPGLDMISFGPTIEGAHSPTEKVNINDVAKFYELMKAILAELAEKK